MQISYFYTTLKGGFMYNIILFSPLPILIIGAYLLNRRKDIMTNGNIYLNSFFEGLGAYLIVLSILLEGFIANPLLKVFYFILGVGILAYSKRAFDGGEVDTDTMFETTKNLFVLFSSTILLFYVMLTVFRFQTAFLQILYALIVVVLFNILTIFMKRLFIKIWEKIDFHVSMFVSFSSIYLYLSVFFVIFLIIFFNFPNVSVSKALNLNNSKSYFSFPDGAVELTNRYKADKLFEYDMDESLDSSAFINQENDYIFIHLRNEIIIYKIDTDQIIYYGPIEDEIDGINITRDNIEENETKYQNHCQDTSNCIVYDYPYQYGDVVYKTYNRITIIEDLEYSNSEIAVFTDQIIHFFENDKIDSRLDTEKDRPFIGFGYSTASLADVDNYQGKLIYLQVDGDEESMSVEVYKVIEKEIGLDLPFYNHYRFGIIFFIFLLGFVPITNYDVYRK